MGSFRNEIASRVWKGKVNAFWRIFFWKFVRRDLGGSMKKILVLLLALIMMLTLFACKEEAPQKLILATTTSTENSGLLAEILPDFEEKTGITVEVVAIGTGAALQKGRDGDADILLVHAKASEEEFVSENHGLRRSDVMYNDFVIVGPKEDPAGLKSAGSDVKAALQMILESEAIFVSRGDDSGTHKKEKSLWASMDAEPNGDWYLQVGKGMGDTLSMTNELLGYTMTDRATYLSMQDNLELEIVLEGDALLFNQYGIIPVNPDKNDMINAEAAEKFEEWLLNDAQELIKTFGIEKYGQPLFVPNAQ
jgi:tungstate transport system substrate-binding protein